MQTQNNVHEVASNISRHSVFLIKLSVTSFTPYDYIQMLTLQIKFYLKREDKISELSYYERVVRKCY